MQNQKKEEIKTSTMKAHQMPNGWQHLTCIKVPFPNQKLQNDTLTPDFNIPMKVA